jgi:hypothetical protein
MTNLNQKIEKALTSLGMTVKFDTIVNPKGNSMSIFHKNGTEMSYEMVHMFLFVIDNRMSVETIAKKMEFTLNRD